MTTVTRESRRKELVSIFQANLTGTGKPFQAIYGHDRRDFEGQSPVLLVLSEGIARLPFGVGTSKYQAPMRFALLSFVREADEDSGWTSAMVEDALDQCEGAIADSIMAYRKHTPYWINLMFLGDYSIIVPAIVGGKPYKLEQMIVEAEVYDP